MSQQSFSLKVGADTKDFNKALKDADNQIRTTTRLGDALTKTLEHKYDAKTAEQAQKQFQKALSDTQEKAEALRAQLKHMEEAGKVDSNQYRKLETDLAKATLEAAQLGKKLEDVDNMKFDNIAKNIEKVGDAIESAGKKLLPFSAAAGGALAGSVKLAKDAVAVGDDLATLAGKYDMSTKAIQQWQYVAMQSDVSSDVLYKAAQKVQSAMGDKLLGTANAATAALDGLGLSNAKFTSNEEAFQAVVEAMSKIENQAEQAAVAGDIFGDRFATELIPLFKQGEDAISDYIKEFEQVGYLSEETIDQLADLDNVVNTVTAQFELAKTELGVAMIPVYQALIDILRDHVIPMVKALAEWFDNLSPAGQNAVIAVLGVIAILGPLLILVGKVATGIGGLIKLGPHINNMLTAMGTTAGRAAIAGGALFAALALIFEVVTNWQLMSGFQKVISILGILTVVALGAAIAFGAFNSAWSLGLAVAGIVAGIVAVTAAVNSAKNSIEESGADLESPDIFGGSGASNGYNATDYANKADAISQAGASGYYNQQNSDYSKTDNSQNTFNIYVDSNEYVSADEIVNIVSKKIATLSSARG